MTKPNEKVLDKIRKILALAGNNPSEAEAQSALLKAQKLMAEHNLSMADLEVTGGFEQEVVEIPAHEPNKTPWWYGQLGLVIANNFRCKVFIQGRNYGRIRRKQVVFLGLKDDAETCKTLFHFALLYIQYQTKRLRAKYRKQGKPTNGIANDYIQGFIDGLAEKFKEQVKTDNSLALMVVTPHAVMEAWNQMNFNKAKQPKYHRAFNSEAYLTGHIHGKNFDSPSAFIEG